MSQHKLSCLFVKETCTVVTFTCPSICQGIWNKPLKGPLLLKSYLLYWSFYSESAATPHTDDNDKPSEGVDETDSVSDSDSDEDEPVQAAGLSKWFKKKPLKKDQTETPVVSSPVESNKGKVEAACHTQIHPHYTINSGRRKKKMVTDVTGKESFEISVLKCCCNSMRINGM